MQRLLEEEEKSGRNLQQQLRQQLANASAIVSAAGPTAYQQVSTPCSTDCVNDFSCLYNLRRQDTVVMDISKHCHNCMSEVQQSLRCALKFLAGLIILETLFLAG